MPGFLPLMVTGEIMRYRTAGIALALAAFSLAHPAQAEITRLRLRFVGGCHSGNPHGSCTIETIAVGEDFEKSPGIQLFSASTHKGDFRKVSNFKRKLDRDGRARSRFKNIAGACYQMRIAKTEAHPAVVSDIICETAEGQASKIYPIEKQAEKKSVEKKKTS